MYKYLCLFLFLIVENSNLSGEETSASERVRGSLPDNAVEGEEVILRLPAGKLLLRLCRTRYYASAESLYSNIMN